MTRWVVTDLDGTLLDHSYSWEPARSTISALKQQGILVIPCTSKTAEEVRAFRQDAGLRDPFIVENGGAIYGNNADGSEWVVPLGAAHSVLRPQLDELSQALGHELVALEDLSAEQGEALTGLRGQALASAQRREWSVPFLTAPEDLREPLRQLAAQHQLLVVQGNRMSHLLSGGSHKGRAVEVLKQHLQQPDVAVLGLETLLMICRCWKPWIKPLWCQAPKGHIRCSKTPSPVAAFNWRKPHTAKVGQSL